MRNLIATAQLIVLTVVAISIMREFKHNDANSDARLKLLTQTFTVEPPYSPPEANTCAAPPAAFLPTT